MRPLPEYKSFMRVLVGCDATRLHYALGPSQPPMTLKLFASRAHLPRFQTLEGQLTTEGETCFHKSTLL